MQGEESVKERFTLDESKVVPFLEQEYTLEQVGGEGFCGLECAIAPMDGMTSLLDNCQLQHHYVCWFVRICRHSSLPTLAGKFPYLPTADLCCCCCCCCNFCTGRPSPGKWVGG
jgi:hypothetical protein